MNAKASTAALRPPVTGCSFFGSAFRAIRLAVNKNHAPCGLSASFTLRQYHKKPQAILDLQP